jgi:hypothetical protein
MDPRPERARLAGYLLDLLDAPERRSLDDQLGRDESLRLLLDRLREAARPLAEGAGDHLPEWELEALVGGGLGSTRRHAALAHLAACRECRFTLSVARSTGGGRGASRMDPPLRRLRHVRLGLAAAALVAVGLVGLLWQANRVAVRTGPVVRLEATRAGEPEVSLRASQALGVTILVEIDFPAPRATWSLVRDEGGLAAGGELRFDPGLPARRSISIHLPPGRLVSGGHVLVLRSADGALERQWRLRIVP